MPTAPAATAGTVVPLIGERMSVGIAGTVPIVPTINTARLGNQEPQRHGDTIYVLDKNYTQHKIRLAGIDAPERKQPYGLASRKHLGSLVVGKTVTVEYRMTGF